MEPNPRGWQSPNCSLRSGVNARGHFLFPPMYQRIGGIGGESTEACLPRPALTDVQIERAETLYVEGASRKNLQFTVHLPASSGKLVEPVKLRDAHSGGYKRTNCGTR